MSKRKIKIDSPGTLVSRIPSLMSGMPSNGHSVLVRIDNEQYGEMIGEYDSLDGAIAAAPIDEDASYAIVVWDEGTGEVDTQVTAAAGLKIAFGVIQVRDILRVFELNAGVARVESLLCDDENCKMCGSLVPMEPNERTSVLPLVFGDMPAVTWEKDFDHAKSVMKELLARVDADPRDEEFFPEGLVQDFQALLSYRGGRDFAIHTFAKAGCFPQVAIRQILDHGDERDPAVLNAALVLAAAYAVHCPELALELVNWVLRREPDHRFGGLLHQFLINAIEDEDDNRFPRWMDAMSGLDPYECYKFALSAGGDR